MDEYPLIKSDDIEPGDIIRELKDGYELGRYLVLAKTADDKLGEWPWYAGTADEERSTFFVCYMLLVGRQYSSIWSQRTDPGDIYYLSVYEVTEIHRWERLVKGGDK